LNTYENVHVKCSAGPPFHITKYATGVNSSELYVCIIVRVVLHGC